MASLQTKKVKTNFTSLVLGNNFSTGNGNIIAGENNTVLTSNSFISGSNNYVGNNISSAYIIGENNYIDTPIPESGSTATTIQTVYSNVTILGVSNLVLTALTNDTVYVPNIQFTSSAGTINGISVTNIVTAGSLWTSGSTGTKSITALNSTGTDAQGNYAVAEGDGTLAYGVASHAEGQATVAFGIRTHAQNVGTQAVGDNSHAEGNSTLASGLTSHAEGYLTTAAGSYSHSEGAGTTAFGTTSHAEGDGTKAIGSISHAEGYLTTASGNQSHSEGDSTIASGPVSHAGGYGTIANHYGEWARSSNGAYITGFGQYGIIDMMGSTTGSTAQEIFIGALNTERLTLGVLQGYKYRINIIAQDASTGDVKEWEGTGLIRNTLGTTTMVGSSIASTYGDASLSTASVAVTADNINDSLKVEVTGIAATNITWYARIDYTRVN